jgi:hypothetical protein
MHKQLVCKVSTVDFTYSEHGYSELPVIRNKYFWPEFCPSLFNVKNYGYSEHGYKELSLIRNSFYSPNAIKSTENYTFITNSKISAIRKQITHFLLSFSSAQIKTWPNVADILGTKNDDDSQSSEDEIYLDDLPVVSKNEAIDCLHKIRSYFESNAHKNSLDIEFNLKSCKHFQTKNSDFFKAK